MSAFVDSTLLRFAQDAFVTNLLNGIGLPAIFNATFDATDIALQSVTLGPVSTRSYKVPTFETVRSNGTDERILPDTQRVRKERVMPRSGRLEWVDVAFDAVLNTKVQTLVAPLQSVTSQTLEQKLGGISSIAELRTKLLALYAPSIVDALFAPATSKPSTIFTATATMKSRAAAGSFGSNAGGAAPISSMNRCRCRSKSSNVEIFSS